jgi:hypothetical protein
MDFVHLSGKGFSKIHLMVHFLFSGTKMVRASAYFVMMDRVIGFAKNGFPRVNSEIGQKSEMGKSCVFNPQNWPL